jgi:hypothetical protein
LIIASTFLTLVTVAGYGKERAAAPYSLAIIDVTVVPMSRNELRPHQTVLIQGERIVAIGPADTVRVPGGVTRVSGSGRYLMPGLIDMHVHFLRRPTEADPEEWRYPDYAERNQDFGLLFVANGVTSVRQMHAHPVGDDLMSRSSTMGWLGPRIYSTGPITDGDPPEWPIARVVKTPADAVHAVQSDKAAGYSGIKVYDALSLPLYDAVAAAAAAEGLDVVGHVPDAVGLTRAIEANQWTIEHTDSFLLSLQPGTGPYVVPPPQVRWSELERRADLAKLPRFADAMRRSGTWTCPTVVVNQMYSKATTWSEELRFVPAEISAKLIQRYSGGSNHDFDQDLAFSLAVVSGLHSRGAGILLGSDTFKLNVVPGFSALHELDYLVRAGLTPYDALRTGTVNAALALHEIDSLGTIDIGKRADLLLLSANPLLDVRNVNHRVGVLLRGRWLPESELQIRLESVARAITAAQRK